MYLYSVIIVVSRANSQNGVPLRQQLTLTDILCRYMAYSLCHVFQYKWYTYWRRFSLVISGSCVTDFTHESDTVD